MRRQTSLSICSLCATRGEFLALSVAAFLMWANRTITKSGSLRSMKAPYLDAKWDIPPGTPLAAVSVFEVQTRNQPQGTEVESRAGRPKSRASQLLMFTEVFRGTGTHASLPGQSPRAGSPAISFCLARDSPQPGRIKRGPGLL